MDQVPEKINFPATEEETLKYWDQIDAFKTSLEKSKGKPRYSFYDGPPFATGLPHYGHILAGTMKDIVTRYAHQTGHYVERRFGWDCHGLPVEYEIDKKLNIKSKEDVMKLGIPQYNKECRSIVMKYSSEWEHIVKRLGRWIDFKNDYKTLDVTFMESVWWVFKQLYDKGMVYQGFKVMPYSTGCTTPLSNFEASQEGTYREVDDPAIVVSFPLEEDPQVSFVAWTTTPWTLPSNLSLCVHPELTYVKLVDKKTERTFILCEDRIQQLYKKKDEYKVLEKFPGKTLEGKKYKPLFDYFVNHPSVTNPFRVLVDDYVTNDSGTGIVHQAPAFGEDDYRCCLKAGIIQKGEGIICPVDEKGHFTAEVVDFAGQYVKAADKAITAKLKEMKRCIKDERYKHSYPFCWRSDTPLIYKAVPSWFIAVEKVKDQLLENNKKSYWVPEYVQEKRFHNWLANARDWAVSRNRYWGTPIPIWISDDREEIVVVGSIEELERLSGVRVTDLHRESVDHITIPSQKGKGQLKRVEEVFDCWFESGSMPYAQLHYPFENKEVFEQSFPADFIAEGIDQTRGWFYTLLVISTILFGKPPFKNLIVNGLVLASDGKKMSKRLKNYPDPLYIVHEYGADALRLYLINSPVVRGESLKFQEGGVNDVVKDVFRPWFHAYRFFYDSVVLYNNEGENPFVPDSSLALSSNNTMDKWILAATNSLIKFVRQEMEGYRLYTVIPRLVKFIEQLTNWFIKLNRKRLKGRGAEGREDCRVALSTLYEVLMTITRAMAPFTPFLTEYFYQNLKKLLPESEREDSIHYMMFPTPTEGAINPEIEEIISRMQSVIELGRNARNTRNVSFKYPLKKLTVIQKDEKYLDSLKPLKSYILDELSVQEIEFTTDESVVSWSAKPDFNLLGKRLRNDLGKVRKAINEMTQDQIRTFLDKGEVELAGHTISSDELHIIRGYKGDTTNNEAVWDDTVLVVLNLEVDEDMKQEGFAREVINRIQKLRKKVGIVPTDPIEVFYHVEKGSYLSEVMKNKLDVVVSTVGKAVAPLSMRQKHYLEIGKEECNISGETLQVYINYQTFSFSPSLLSKCPDETFFSDLQKLIVSREYQTLLKEFEKQGKKTFVLNDKSIELEWKKDIFPGVSH